MRLQLTASSLLLLSVILQFSCNSVSAYKYLAVLPTYARSHFSVGSSLMKALAEKGHEVYVISPYPQKHPIENYHDIPLTTVGEAMEGTLNTLLASNKKSAIENTINFFLDWLMMTEVVLKESSVQDLMVSNHTFDAVICEVFLSEALFGLSEHFNAPLIGLSAYGASMWNTDLVGSPSPPSYVPSPALKFSDHMSLTERVVNLAFLTVNRLLFDFFYLPREFALYSKYFPNAERDLYEVRKNTALVLLNTHVSLAYPRPYVPNQIEVGGMHINRRRQPLPEDISKFIEEAEHGVIYFSMGSNLKSKDLPLEKKNEILKVFSSIKQRVLWKFEDTQLEGKSDNVFISDWFPQNDILAHENVKVFITHGGLLGTIETIYHAKPVIGIPIFGDQHLNMANAENRGYGIKLDYKTLNSNSLMEALERVLNDSSFQERVTEISERYRDQEMLPMDKAVYWVEHVVRTKGAKYLHCVGLDLNFIEYHNIDAILILYGGICFVLFSILYLIVFFVKILLQCFKPKARKNKQKKH